MQTTTTHQATDTEPQGHGGHPEHAVSLPTYWKVFAALMVLLIATLVAAMWDLGPVNLPFALLIAVAKAALVMMFFMHLKFSTRLVQFFGLGALIWLMIMFVLTLMDYVTRGRMGQLN